MCSVIPTGSSCVPENPSRIAPCPRNTCNPCAKDKNVNDGGGTYPVLNPCECGQPNCVPMQTLRYIQPPRRESYKPLSRFAAPTTAMESGTIYKKSYPDIDPITMAQCRSKSVKPHQNFAISGAKIQNETVTTMSYPGHCNIPRTRPILPKPPSLLREGRMQEMTTQKHDYVNKPAIRRQIIAPRHCLAKPCAPFEKCTTQKLSYLMPDNFSPSVSCRPNRKYTRPNQPMDTCTTQKLSYQPVCPAPKEALPWAQRPKYRAPNIPMDSCTTYKLSFFNCGDKPARTLSCKPMPKFQSPDCPMDAWTVYKRSYPDIDPITMAQCRSKSVKPNHNFAISGAKIQNGTVTTMSYPGHCNIPRTRPILPKPPSLLHEGRMQEMTTQKHDFVCKAQERRKIIMPKHCLAKPCAPFESCTTNKLSYQPNKENFIPTESCRPVRQFQIPNVAMDCNTTQKLSFAPVEVMPKQKFPWMERPKYRPPNVKMACETIQKQSYQPPGCYVQGDSSGCCCPPGCPPPVCDFPTASVC